MKTQARFLFFIIIIGFYSCEKDEFNLDKPNVSLFVEQLKNGTYNEKGEGGGAIMPTFGLEHVAQLIKYASDTSFIPELSCVPSNPISSRLMWPINRPGKVILGEYLLWCAQYAIDGHFPSLDPFWVNMNEEQVGKGITAKEVLVVRNYYENWWNLNDNKENDSKTPHPLDGTPYHWF